MAKGHWIEVPIHFIARAARSLRNGDYSVFDFAFLTAFAIFVVWLFFIRASLLDRPNQAGANLVRYSFGTCLLGHCVLLFALALYLGAL